MSNIEILLKDGPNDFSLRFGCGYVWPLVEEFCKLKQKKYPEDGVHEFRVCWSSSLGYTCQIWLEGAGGIYEHYDKKGIMWVVSMAIYCAIKDMQYP